MRGRGVAGRRAWKKERTDKERHRKKVTGKVSTVIHSADVARFQACEIAAEEEEEEEEELLVTGLLQKAVASGATAARQPSAVYKAL